MHQLFVRLTALERSVQTVTSFTLSWETLLLGLLNILFLEPLRETNRYCILATTEKVLHWTKIATYETSF